MCEFAKLRKVVDLKYFLVFLSFLLCERCSFTTTTLRTLTNRDPNVRIKLAFTHVFETETFQGTDQD